VINNATDEARRIFGRTTGFMICRVASVMDIMFLVVLSIILIGFVPLTAIMVVIMSLLDDVLMAIAFDNTLVSGQPIRWQMPGMLGPSLVSSDCFRCRIVHFSIDRHSGAVASTSAAILWTDRRESAPAVMFLKLVGGGYLLFVNRTERRFFLPPFPAALLVVAILLTQLAAASMCGFRLLVPDITLRSDGCGSTASLG
jgi:H+-transporting ATPase